MCIIINCRAAPSSIGLNSSNFPEYVLNNCIFTPYPPTYINNITTNKCKQLLTCVEISEILKTENTLLKYERSVALKTEEYKNELFIKCKL